MASNTLDIEKTRYLLLLEFALSLSKATGLKTLKADVIPKLKYIMDFNRCGLALLNEEKSSYRLLTLLETRPAYSWPSSSWRLACFASHSGSARGQCGGGLR